MKITKIRDVRTPHRGTEKSAGIDLYVPFSEKAKLLFPGDDILIPSGIKAAVPAGHALIMFNKSGIATKKQLIVGACVIDEDYQGEIHIHLINAGLVEQVIQPDDKVAQFICVPVSYIGIEEVDIKDLYNEQSERGEGGFGSTNDK